MLRRSCCCCAVALTAANPNGKMPPREELPMERRGSRLSRRQFVVGATSAVALAGCGRLPGQSQTPPPTKLPHVGVVLGSPSAAQAAPGVDGLLQGLRD